MAVAFFFRKGARGYGFCLGAQDLGGKNIAEGGGGPLGSGRQWMPWIHVADLARLYMHAATIQSSSLPISGPINSVAPVAVRNSEFTQLLARQLHRPAFLPVPYLGLRLAFGEFAQVLFASQHVIPKVALDSGFVFQFPELAAALRDILATEISTSKSIHASSTNSLGPSASHAASIA